MFCPRVVIADDHAIVAEGFRSILEPECKIVGTASNGHELLTGCKSLQPDVALVDLGMPGMSGIEAGKEIKRRFPRIRQIVVTIYNDTDIAAEVLRSWASAYVLKNAAATELQKAVREVANGRSYVSPPVSRRLQERFVTNPHEVRRRSLTLRQQEVLQLLYEGRTMIEAARRLHITPRTLAFHKYQIMEAFGLKNGSELMLFAIKERQKLAGLHP